MNQLHRDFADALLLPHPGRDGILYLLIIAKYAKFAKVAINSISVLSFSKSKSGSRRAEVLRFRTKIDSNPIRG
jgi:hypothetical protein